METRTQRQQHRFDLSGHRLHRIKVSLTGKMDAHAGVPLGWAEPQHVLRHAPDLGGPSKAVDAVADDAQFRNRRRRLGARHHVFALQMPGRARHHIGPEIKLPSGATPEEGADGGGTPIASMRPGSPLAILTEPH